MQFNSEDNTISLDTLPLSKAINRILEAQSKVVGTVTSMEDYVEFAKALVHLANTAMSLHQEIRGLEHFLDQKRLQ